MVVHRCHTAGAAADPMSTTRLATAGLPVLGWNDEPPASSSGGVLSCGGYLLRCCNAEAATDFSAFVLLELERTFDAADATALLVRPPLDILLTSSPSREAVPSSRAGLAGDRHTRLADDLE